MTEQDTKDFVRAFRQGISEFEYTTNSFDTLTGQLTIHGRFEHVGVPVEVSVKFMAKPLLQAQMTLADLMQSLRERRLDKLPPS